MAYPVLPPLEKRVGCIGAAMHVIGNKWTALILRDLSSGPKRFKDFEYSIPKINPRTLSIRLRDLQTQGIVETCCDETGYQLTAKGTALIPVLKAMAEWGDTYA